MEYENITREQRQKYQIYREIDWEFYCFGEDYIEMRKNVSSILDDFSWKYLKIYLNGKVEERIRS